MKCNTCNKPKCDCDPCGAPKCGCTKPVIEVSEVPGSTSALKFNFNGVSTRYDFYSMIKNTETDTSLSADSVARVLRYMAERHVDSISAAELGSILHLADIGDVDVAGLENGSQLVYKKDSNCAEGCEGIDNSWIAYNSLDHITDSLQYLSGYDSNGDLKTLGTPNNANQYYQLGWNGSNKLSYSQPKIVSTAPVDGDGKKWRVYVDPADMSLCIVKES